MRKMILLIGLSLLVLITACSSTESKEVMEYHNSFITEIVDRVIAIDEAYEKMDIAETDEEGIAIANNEIVPILDEMKAYMDSQKPTKDDTKEYHKLRSDWFKVYSEIVESELKALDDYVNGLITEEELDERFEESFIKYEEMEVLVEKADEKIDELADKYKFEEEIDE